MKRPTFIFSDHAVQRYIERFAAQLEPEAARADLERLATTATWIGRVSVDGEGWVAGNVCMVVRDMQNMPGVRRCVTVKYENQRRAVTAKSERAWRSVMARVAEDDQAEGAAAVSTREQAKREARKRALDAAYLAELARRYGMPPNGHSQAGASGDDGGAA